MDGVCTSCGIDGCAECKDENTCTKCDENYISTEITGENREKSVTCKKSFDQYGSDIRSYIYIAAMISILTLVLIIGAVSFIFVNKGSQADYAKQGKPSKFKRSI